MGLFSKTEPTAEPTKARQKHLYAPAELLIARDWRKNQEWASIRLESNSVEAGLVFAFLERWGMVQAHDSGEDSAGRAKLALMPVPEVVERACQMAELSCSELRRRGWLAPNPIVDATLNAETED